MNVTTSSNWARPPVGIVRVEQELAAQLSRLYGESFKRCLWRNGDFVELDFLVQTDSHEDGSAKDVAAAQASIAKTELPLLFPVVSRKQALINIGQGLISLAPIRFRPFLNKVAHRLRPKVTQALSAHWIARFRMQNRKPAENHVISYFQKPKASQNKKCVKSIFQPGDILVSVGLDWDYDCYKNFYNLRKCYGVKIVTCCYDLIPVLYPQYCVQNVSNRFMSYFLDVADGSDLILCISKKTESDLLDMLWRVGGPKVNTAVFQLGDNIPEINQDKKPSSEIGSICKEPFILFVSTVERRKNHEVLYRAYHLLCKQGHKKELPKLVFVGMHGWGVGELLKDIELDPFVEGLIVRLDRVSDVDLAHLYRNATFCVFPSLYEGWGLPVGEALSLGKAVICSDRGSLPEVGGDLVRYADPWNANQWAREILRMATDDAWRLKYESLVKAKYVKRTWEQTARTVYDFIERELG